MRTSPTGKSKSKSTSRRTRRTPKVTRADNPTAQTRGGVTRRTKSVGLIPRLQYQEQIARAAIDRNLATEFNRGYYLGLAHGFNTAAAMVKQ